MAIPVYIFCGFLESGKTTLIQTTLRDEGFNEGEKTLLLVFEEGIEEYDDKFLKETYTNVEYFDDLSQLNTDILRELDNKYTPDRVMVEFNGTWNIDDFLDIELPLDWIVVQILSTIDASTFTNYINNMRTFMFNVINPADVIVFNRCDENTKKAYLRTNVKSINKGAQIIYELKDGTISPMTDEEMPFDLSADVIEINDDDYGLWYMDALDNARKYDGKTVVIQGRVMRRREDPDDIYVIGRNAMVCCAEDTQLIGYMVKSKHAEQMVDGDWLQLKAKMHVVYDEEYHGEVPMLEEISYKRIPPLKEELVYFS
ncbi:GTP-binding protein [uncultured Traorella sp.]|mgnify:FL=1|uniref:TIGR03943 family putative permease subunit n=1 Tax=uncultured Traorella sp. TaxID=1929048 RepID=UPI0025EB9039|nr:GTP-binding protein [uncultured Traorella sp.]